MAQTSNGGQPAPVPFMVIARELDEATSVVAIEGELDLSSAPRVKWVLTDALEEGRTRLVVDLSKASFMDSTGLGVLIGVSKRLEQRAELLVVCPSGPVRQVFEFSGTDGVFVMFSTLDEAIEHLAARPAAAG
jgi:anti-sigma B factor antagonist